MRNYYKLIFIVLLMAGLLIPFYPVTIVPEWEIQFVNKDGTLASSVRLEQTWENYSLVGIEGRSGANIQTDSNGYIKLPSREVRVPILLLIIAPIRDTVVSINPHASYGSHSSVFCYPPHNCVVSYKESNEKPQRFILW